MAEIVSIDGQTDAVPALGSEGYFLKIGTVAYYFRKAITLKNPGDVFSCFSLPWLSGFPAFKFIGGQDVQMLLQPFGADHRPEYGGRFPRLLSGGLVLAENRQAKGDKQSGQ